jgi:hypothetical protein
MQGSHTPRGDSACPQARWQGWNNSQQASVLKLQWSLFFLCPGANVHFFVSSLRGPVSPRSSGPPGLLDCCYLKTS